MPIRVETAGGATTDRFAIVRSVAVTAPIEAPAADERHRVAILCLVDPASDLRLLLEDGQAAAHTDERRRLAALLSHGLDSLADVLRRTVAGVGPGSDPGLTPRWLAEYLQRRIHVTAWLLDHWNTVPPPHDSAAAVDWPEEFQMTLPVRGGLGFFLTEVLSNAMRHGVAGSAPRVTIRCEAVPYLAPAPSPAGPCLLRPVPDVDVEEAR